MSIEIARPRRGQQSTAMAVRPENREGAGQLVSAPSQQEETYDEPYVPGEGEMGLLEVYYNTRHSGEKIPVCSRPTHELAKNFTDFENQPVNLADPILLRGKLSAMQDAMMGNVHDSAVISGAQFKGIAGELDTFMAHEYILVGYKDYSQWAAHSMSEGGLGWLNPFGKKYVKRFFAIEMGSEPGMFIEITEKQFLVGCNKLHRKRVRAPGAGRKTGLQNYEALNQEQFNAVYNKKEVEAGHSSSNSDAHREEPVPRKNMSALDVFISYTPLGYYRRVRDETYKAIGNAVVTIAVTSAAVFVLYRYCVRPFLPSSGRQPASYRSTRRQAQQSWEPAGFFGYRVGDVFDRILGT
eukprot:TRINITY_DN5573_c0_g2_i1.p1 TRINITY_DN5573_c0_g2~~TRINITY_DN5573_c0_g2_i1.p1  ORF type:complete len:353 (+),score=38.20 TRINITY_DN5573_c0_g2_i1:58-1116(+)